MKLNEVRTISYTIENLAIEWKNERSDELYQDIINWAFDQVYECGFGRQFGYYAYDEDFQKDIRVEFDIKLI